jgi:hypothetical protein
VQEPVAGEVAAEEQVLGVAVVVPEAAVAV